MHWLCWFLELSFRFSFIEPFERWLKTQLIFYIYGKLKFPRIFWNFKFFDVGDETNNWFSQHQRSGWNIGNIRVLWHGRQIIFFPRRFAAALECMDMLCQIETASWNCWNQNFTQASSWCADCRLYGMARIFTSAVWPHPSCVRDFKEAYIESRPLSLHNMDRID